MPLVLAIEPDLRQAAIVKRVIKEKVQADLAVVDSRDAAIEAIRARVPDVLLLSALLSPRDEQELMAHLRTLDNAEHLQTHTIPQLASSLQRAEEGQGLLGRFRRKKGAAVSAGCDPDVFAEEVRVFVDRAEQKKRERELFPQRSIVSEIKSAQAAAATAAPEAAPAAAASSWDSPFEWPASGRDAAAARTTVPAEPLIASRESVMTDREPLIPERGAPVPDRESLIPDRASSNPEPLLAQGDSPIRYSDLLPGSPVSSIHDRVEFPSGSTAMAAQAAEAAAAPAPAPMPEPPDTLAPFLMFDHARGLRRDAARWMRADAREAGSANRETKGARWRPRVDERLAVADPIRVRIRSIRVQPAA